jgi:hypothetical protein
MDRSVSAGGVTQAGYLLTAVVVAMIAFTAYGNYFIQDDGFISLRYADHWARGHGPVWYPGSTEFGYTNFLFVALCAGLLAVGADAVLAAGIVSYTGFAIAVLAAYAIVSRLTRDTKIAALCIFVIFTNFTVSSYASGLLETSLQAGLVLLTYWGVIRYAEAPAGWLPLAIAVAASLAMLTRLDSSLLLLPAGVYTLRHLKSPWHLAVFLAVPTLIVGGFLAFCYLQYGQILPNTFYAKAGGSSVALGIGYLKLFLDAENFLYAVFLLAVFMLIYHRSPINSQRRKQRPELLLAAAPVVLWGIYVLYVGGGFMGFRLMVPVIVFFFILCFVAAAPFKPYRLLAGLAVYAVLTSLTHQWISSPLFETNRVSVQSIRTLNGHVVGDRMNWGLTGRRLRELFYSGSPDDVSIAVTAAGAIPFYSGLPAVDILGLNDRWVLRHGDTLEGGRPGHRKIAPLSYLKQRKVSLIIDHPVYVCGDSPVNPYPGKSRQRYRGMPVLLVPIADGCRLITYYNDKHPRLERMLREGRLKILPGT